MLEPAQKLIQILVLDDDDDDDSLLHIFALKMNYNMFTLAIRKNIKIYTFFKSILGLGLQVCCEKLQLLQLLRNLKFKFKNVMPTAGNGASESNFV